MADYRDQKYKAIREAVQSARDMRLRMSAVFREEGTLDTELVMDILGTVYDRGRQDGYAQRESDSAPDPDLD
jgi:hypothetical protein